MSSLKNHPFAVETFFKTSLVLTFAVPKAELGHKIPECLEPDLLNDQWAFLAIALVDTKRLRPKGFPLIMGHDFVLAGYRIFVRYTNAEGKGLRGLYILKSETNKKFMSFLGNFFTHYKYSTSDIHFTRDKERIIVASEKSGLDIEVSTSRQEINLPKDSPFKDWKEARRFAGPLPFTFTFNNKSGEVLIIEGVREGWTPRPVKVIRSKVGFIDQSNFKHIVLASGFIIENIPYYWKKGKTEIWKGK